MIDQSDDTPDKTKGPTEDVAKAAGDAVAASGAAMSKMMEAATDIVLPRVANSETADDETAKSVPDKAEVEQKD